MIAIIGSNGQLGWELVGRTFQQGIEALALDVPEIDITDPASIEKNLSAKELSLVVNAAAYTAVAQAESEPDLAYAVNRDGAAHLAEFCKQSAIPFIHISTDYVFNGSKAGPYSEDDPVAPLGIYGRSKESGETEVRERVHKHLIIRTAWLYGVHGRNFVKTMLRLGKERESIKVVDDQSGCPTYAADLANAILSMVNHIQSGKKTLWGTYHYCGGGSTTWYGFAKRIFQIARDYENLSVKKVIPIATEEFPTPVKRPANSILDCSKIERNFGVVTRPWAESLSEMIDGVYADNST